MRSITKIVLWPLTALALLAMPIAQAGIISFNFIPDDGIHAVTGEWTIADTNSGVSNGQVLGRAITSVTGFVSGPRGGNITGLVPNPDSPNPVFSVPGYIFNNITFTAGPAFDLLGPLFTAGGVNWNIYFDGEGKYFLGSFEARILTSGIYTSVGPALPGGSPFPFQPRVPIPTIPEPGTNALFAVGCIGLLAMVRRKKQSLKMVSS